MLGLYIHWPFCISKCPYCDFNSHVREKFDEDLWLQAIITEMQRVFNWLDAPHKLHSIFFGGGTPSLMQPPTVAKIIEKAVSLWSCIDDLEISLEANPNSVETENFKNLAISGVNRISLGIQSLIDKDLQKLGRKHSSFEAMQAIDIAQKNFNRVSIDLIYARFDQTLKDWEQELKQAISFNTEHLSLYQLTIEPGTAFATQYQRGKLLISDTEKAAALYELTETLVSEAKYKPYEVSNYSKSNSECHHNLIYWRYQDYVGIGPGAHGRLTVEGQKFATQQIKAPELWLKAIQNNGHGDAIKEIISPNQQYQEKILMGLRLAEGLNLNDLQIEHKFLDPLQIEGLIEIKDNKVMPTLSGRLKLNAVIDYILHFYEHQSSNE